MVKNFIESTVECTYKTYSDFSITPLTGVTASTVDEYADDHVVSSLYKGDLIHGDDRFLAMITPTGEGRFVFTLVASGISKLTDYVRAEYDVASFLIEQGLTKKGTCITLR